jgi:hypothetical protein
VQCKTTVLDQKKEESKQDKEKKKLKTDCETKKSTNDNLKNTKSSIIHDLSNINKQKKKL